MIPIQAKNEYSMRIYSDRLLPLTRRCPDDGTWMKATGDMYLSSVTSEWFVEYLCPKDGEIIRGWMPEIYSITKQIADNVLTQRKEI
jgi:hypothetical protein